MTQPTRFRFSELRACAKRELRLRRNVYPRRIANNQMTERKAADEIAMMLAIVAHFADLAEGERGEELFK